MKVVIAEDDTTFQEVLYRLCQKWGYEVLLAKDGTHAWEILTSMTEPFVALLDRLMPGLNGIELCQKINSAGLVVPKYLIIVTSLGNNEEIIAGFNAGADDYVVKPFFSEELRLRIRVGERIVMLQSSLSKNIVDLEQALTHIKTLQKILPVCSFCHRIQDDQESWQRIEHYLSEH